MADIQKYIIKRGKRSAISKFLHEKKDKEVIATWMQRLDKIRRVFEVRLFLTHPAISNFQLLDRTCKEYRSERL